MPCCRGRSRPTALTCCSRCKRLWRPVFKEFDVWPEISIEPDPPREKKEKKESIEVNNLKQSTNTPGQKMTRKNRPKIKEKEEKEPKGGYCEMCNTDYADAALHRRSPHHLAFVRDHTNFLALDSLISSGADVTTFLDKATPINGERRSLRKMCNGDIDPPKRRSKRSQSPDSTMNGESPKRNGGLDDEKKHNTRCSKRTEAQEDKQYYKVVSTKLRSSGGFQTKPKDTSPARNGTKPLVVKFRKVRRSELSVLSDEAEQFMFPKRASSTSSTSSDDEKDVKEIVLRPKSTPQPTPISVERRRLARPIALKEESSEEDSWPEDNRRRKRRAPVVVKRARRNLTKPAETPKPEPAEPIKEPTPQPDPDISPLREEPAEKCMKWEDGKLKYTPAVEQLEFAFESVPRSEPWYETFKRQDQDKVIARNVSQYFSMFSKSPKLPYEMGQLPPLKPNCCPLSDLTKREEKQGPSRSYGTRGMKKQKIRKRTAAILALESHPRKSPREHASTLAILGSAGLLQRRKHDDAKSTASEDTLSDAPLKQDPPPSEMREASERLQQFFSELFEDAAELELAEDLTEGRATLAVATNAPDVTSLVSEYDRCDLIRNEITEVVGRPRGKRGKFKKKNRTGWPNKRKQKKESRANSVESEKTESLERSSAEPPEDDNTRDGTAASEETDHSETENDTPKDLKAEDSIKISDLKLKLNSLKTSPTKNDSDKSLSEEERELKRKKRALQGMCEWLQPVVRVARVEPRTLRSAARPPTRSRPLR